jgi:hypothetical protein
MHTNSYRVLEQDGTLRIAEAVQPECARDVSAETRLDLSTLILQLGRVQTAPEFG